MLFSRKKIINIALVLVPALFLGIFPADASAQAQTVYTEEPVQTADMGQNLPTESAGEPTPTAAPTSTPTQPVYTSAPTATPAVTKKPENYVLTNKGARYSKGKQAGIHYKKVKGKKIYHLLSYTTDTVTLDMNQPSVFRIYGGASKKEVKKKYVTVSSAGVVKCKRAGKGEKRYTIVEATSKKTGEKRYIYIYFQEKLYCNNGAKISLYEKYSDTLGFNYGKKKLSFSISNSKCAAVNGKGKVSAIKSGTAYVTVKVTDSVNNQVRIRIVVKKEPWIVDNKNSKYDYEDMSSDLQKLQKKYPGKASVFSLGKTADNRDLWCIRIGKSGAERKLVIDAGIHAREWKNVQVVMRQTEDMLRDYRDFKERFKETCVYVIPMDNPDGVSIAQYGFGAIRNEKLRKLCKKIGHAKEWKANARGVDLNDNFPAGFHKKGMEKKPSYMAYPGKKAASEKETKALIRFINEINPEFVLNIHSTGNIIYWDFQVDEALHDTLYKVASKIHAFNKYPMMPASSSTAMEGGFADWLNYKKGIASITVETGSVQCPLPHSEYKAIYKANYKMFRWFMTKY